jgi:hypothetical protein
MRYTVTSTSTANNELAFIWAIASDQGAVARASNKIDQLLKHSPLTQGVDQGPFRTLTVDPLTVTYTVSPDDCQVTIWQFIYHG